MKAVMKWSRGLVLAAFASFAAPVAAQTTVRYVHTDALGSVVAMTDESRTVVERREYEPYGEQLSVLADGPGFTGHVQDAATGLTYMQQRYYDPGIGGFLSVDPVTALEKPTTNFNRYIYALNNPYKFTDPDGRDVTCDQSSCMIDSNSVLETVVDYVTVGIIYTGRLIQNATDSVHSSESAESGEAGPSEENTNPYEGPVDSPVIVVDPEGNAIPVEAGERIRSSPDGDYQQVEGSSGQPTGTRLDKGGHKNQRDPQARGPHAHRPGVTDDKGNPHLPINGRPTPPPEPQP